MKNIIIIVLLTVSVIFAQQRPPDEKLLTFNNASTVAAILQQSITGSGTANQLAYFTSPKNIGSLSTNTYPSLTEMTYLKGVTSKIQTQLNGKQATLVSGTNIKTINGQSILGSGDIAITGGTNDTTGFYTKVYSIVKAYFDSQKGTPINGSSATLDSMITDFRKNNFLRLDK